MKYIFQFREYSLFLALHLCIENYEKNQNHRTIDHQDHSEAKSIIPYVIFKCNSFDNWKTDVELFIAEISS